MDDISPIMENQITINTETGSKSCGQYSRLKSARKVIVGSSHMSTQAM